ncbi:MAG: crosslink repair DNA glycosylase YcaQ family protein [Anaerolineae bacterium]
MADLAVGQVRALRVRAQGLHPQHSRDDLVAAVRAVGGIQAQQSAAMMLALRARVAGLTTADVNAAIESGEIARTWLMRGTLHLVAADDLRWMLALLAPVFIPKGRSRRAQLGLTDDIVDKGLNAIRAILAGSAPLTRGEIVARLAERGIALDRRMRTHPPDRAGSAGGDRLPRARCLKRRIDLRLDG